MPTTEAPGRGAGLVARWRRRAQPTGWTFLWGVVAFACFVVLLVSGVILMLVYEPSGTLVVYAGSYAPLRGATMSRAFASTLHLSLDVRGGLLVRQVHHWAALVLPAALLLQLASAFFTGWFRRPRQWAWVLLVATFLLVLAAGWSGYGLPDDNLSGTGLRIVEGTVLALPFVGTWLTGLLFGGEFPGRIIEHLYLVHLGVIVPLLALGAVALRRAWGLVRVRASGLFFVTAGVLTLMAGTMTISPVWLYGPSSPANAYAGSQPDWYTAFLDGALRLVPPGWEVSVGDRTWTLAVLVPLAAVGLFVTLLLLWPFVEARVTGDRADHPVLDRARDTPVRTGFGAAGVTFYGALWLSGSADLLATQFRVSFEGVIWVLRFVVLIGPAVAFVVTRTVCQTLRAAEQEVAEHGAETGLIIRLPSGGYVEEHGPPREVPAPPPVPAIGGTS